MHGSGTANPFFTLTIKIRLRYSPVLRLLSDSLSRCSRPEWLNWSPQQRALLLSRWAPCPPWRPRGAALGLPYSNADGPLRSTRRRRWPSKPGVRCAVRRLSQASHNGLATSADVLCITTVRFLASTVVEAIACIRVPRFIIMKRTGPRGMSIRQPRRRRAVLPPVLRLVARRSR